MVSLGASTAASWVRGTLTSYSCAMVRFEVIEPQGAGCSVPPNEAKHGAPEVKGGEKEANNHTLMCALIERL